MPRKANFRQRGKKHKKEQKDEAAPEVAAAAPVPAPAADDAPEEAAAAAGGDELPAWMGGAAPGGDAAAAALAANAPFGFVDADLKAYLRTALSSLAALAQPDAADEEEGDDGQLSSLEERRALRNAALTEIAGKELAIATDPDTSRVLELLVFAMEPRQCRVLADKLCGSLTTLALHRFGSHVLQSVLQALQRLASLECAPSGSAAATRSPSPSPQPDEGPSRGVLRSACALLEDMVAELLPELPHLLQDAFGTHILRSLLLVLAGRSLNDAQRSKRSQKFRARETVAPDALDEDSAAAARAAQLHIPSSFAPLLLRVRDAAMADLGSNEARALSVSTTGSPTLQLLLELDGNAAPGSTLDLVLDGLLSAPADSVDERSAHVEALMRDVVGSHLLQALLPLLPSAALALFWKRHVQGKLGKLGAHPVANFVVASAARRLPSELELPDDADVEEYLFEHALGELNSSGDKLVKEGKLGVVCALVERAGALGVAYPPPPTPPRGARLESLEERTVRAVRGAFGLDAEQERLLVPVMLSMKSHKAWDKERRRQAEKRRKREQADADAAAAPADDAAAAAPAEAGSVGWTEDYEMQEWEATMQGSVLLQTMTRLSAPANDAVYQNLLALPSLVPLARSSVASHLLVAALASPTATFAQRKGLQAALQPALHLLADMAPRVAYTVWERADGFTKERHVSALLSHERFLLGSTRGRPFLRRINIALFRKSIGEWKKWLATQPPPAPLLPRLGDAAAPGSAAQQQQEPVVVDVSASEPATRKRAAGGDGGAARKKKRPAESALDRILAAVK